MRRRQFLGNVGLGFLGLHVTARAAHHVVSADPLEVAVDLASTNAQYTPAADFYIRNHYSAPAESTATLEISGQVERSLTLSASSLAGLRSVRKGCVLECAGNPVAAVGLASNGLWGGWSLADVIAMARPADRAIHLHFYGGDGYIRNIPIARLEEGALLANSLNGEPLGRNHGAPWRAVFPGWYGMDSVKWLQRIEVADTALDDSRDGYQAITREGADSRRAPLPRIQVKSVIVSPASGDVLHPGDAAVSGLAWSGAGTIAKIELSADGGGEWQAARFDTAPPHEWVRWRREVRVTRRGALELVVRATDDHGNQQPEHADPLRLDHYANHWLHRVHVLIL